MRTASSIEVLGSLTEVDRLVVPTERGTEELLGALLRDNGPPECRPHLVVLSVDQRCRGRRHSRWGFTGKGRAVVMLESVCRPGVVVARSAEVDGDGRVVSDCTRHGDDELLVQNRWVDEAIVGGEKHGEVGLEHFAVETGDAEKRLIVGVR